MRFACSLYVLWYVRRTSFLECWWRSVVRRGHGVVLGGKVPGPGSAAIYARKDDTCSVTMSAHSAEAALGVRAGRFG